MYLAGDLLSLICTMKSVKETEIKRVEIDPLVVPWIKYLDSTPPVRNINVPWILSRTVYFDSQVK